MTISILTLFPAMFDGPFDHSIVKRAQENNLVTINKVNIRDYGIGKHKVVDDKPYGGGVGMVMKVDVLDKAITAAKDPTLTKDKQRIIYVGAHGKPFTQQKAEELASLEHVVFLCGHYEGIDERAKSFIDEEISIGDFIVTGGEIPIMLMTDAIVRLIPGVLKGEATMHESFSLTEGNSSLLEFPQYTMPPEYKGLRVPDVLLSGNHRAIETWRKERAKEITGKLRPDLLRKDDK